MYRLAQFCGAAPRSSAGRTAGLGHPLLFPLVTWSLWDLASLFFSSGVGFWRLPSYVSIKQQLASSVLVPPDFVSASLCIAINTGTFSSDVGQPSDCKNVHLEWCQTICLAVNVIMYPSFQNVFSESCTDRLAVCRCFCFFWVCFFWVLHRETRSLFTHYWICNHCLFRSPVISVKSWLHGPLLHYFYLLLSSNNFLYNYYMSLLQIVMSGNNVWNAAVATIPETTWLVRKYWVWPIEFSVFSLIQDCQAFWGYTMAIITANVPGPHMWPSPWPGQDLKSQTHSHSWSKCTNLKKVKVRSAAKCQSTDRDWLSTTQNGKRAAERFSTLQESTHVALLIANFLCQWVTSLYESTEKTSICIWLIISSELEVLD